MKKVIILVLILASFLTCRSQSKVDAILSKKADSLTVNDIDVLIKSGDICDADPTIIGTMIISVAQKHNISNWNVRQLLDSVNANRKQMNDKVAIQYNHGKDSVFIRDPRGNHMFVGMGQLSFNKMVTLASQNLPANYSGDYDLKINSTEALRTLG